jgi:hypothetical protein
MSLCGRSLISLAVILRLEVLVLGQGQTPVYGGDLPKRKPQGNLRAEVDIQREEPTRTEEA